MPDMEFPDPRYDRPTSLRDYMRQRIPPAVVLVPDDASDPSALLVRIAAQEREILALRDDLDELRTQNDLEFGECVVCGEAAVLTEHFFLDAGVDMQLPFCNAHAMTFDRWVRDLKQLGAEHARVYAQRTVTAHSGMNS